MTDWKPNRWAFLALGVAIGMGIGPVLWDFRSQAPATPVHATATMGADNFAIATGPIDGGVEGLYFLDFLTGDLKATVINPRKAGFSAMFEYNIAQDFDLGSTRNPKYLMVTGTADIPRGRGGTQIARSVVYVTEVTSGQMVAYVIPWDSSRQAAGKPQQGTFYKIGTVPLRSAFVRDQ